MTIFVDALVAHPLPGDGQTRRVGAPYGHRWCHLFCEPDGEDELHALAARIGLKRAWFQASLPVSKPRAAQSPSLLVL